MAEWAGSGPRLRGVVAGIALCTALLAVAAEARAYVLPADAILSGVAKRRSQLAIKTLVLEGQLHHGADDPAPTPIWEVIRPGVGHRIEERSPSGTLVTLTLGQRRWQFRAGEPPPQPVKVKPDLAEIFLVPDRSHENSRAELEFLGANAIADGEISLSRMNSRIAYVIGAKPWESDKPQLWIDKNLRTPVRFISVDPQTKQTVDLRLIDYGSAQTGEWYPRRVEVWKGGQLVEFTSYTHAAVNESIDESLLRPPGGRSR